jgi:hypothetical protein
VNGPEILHLIRHDLQSSVARQGEPPTTRPMDASPWVAMSAMQKAIRRGREDLALSAAATLLRDAPGKLWRRIGCIAYEDRRSGPIGLLALDQLCALDRPPPSRDAYHVGVRQLGRPHDRDDGQGRPDGSHAAH